MSQALCRQASVAMDVDLIDMGEISGAEFSGILIPELDVGGRKVGITSQFLENADVYAERYSSVPYFKTLIERHVLPRLETEPAIVLDFGSGAGNSVIPCLEFFPSAKIVATDLSENLLAILRKHLSATDGWLDRVDLVCVDATKPYFARQAADLVIGAAILHHLVDPALCVRSALAALKPGGIAAFFEPFEAGNAILRLAYADLLRTNSAVAIRNPLSKEAKHLFASMYNDYKVRAALRTDSPLLQELDDKWMFTRSYFQDFAAEYPGLNVDIVALSESDRLFTLQTESNLRLGLGVTQEVARSLVPDWAWKILSEYDESFSPALRRDLPIEACVILRKPLLD